MPRFGAVDVHYPATGGARAALVTAAGLPVAEAASLVAAMAGLHRMPDALRRVDRLSRG